MDKQNKDYRSTKWPSTQDKLIGLVADSLDRQAWTAFVDLYMPPVYRFCLSRGLQNADAEDVVQNVFANVSRAMPQFQYDSQRGRFRSWLFTITCREMRRFFSKVARDRTVGGGDQTLQQLIEDGESTWCDVLYAHVYQVAIANVRAQFDDATWRAFNMTWEQGQAPAEVARQLQKPPHWVYKAKFKVLARLREEIAALAEDEAVLQLP